MKKVMILAAVVLIGAAALLSFSSSNSESKKNEESPGLQVGDKAPDFNLKNVDGKTVSLAGMKASNPSIKGFIVTFTCNTCPYAVMYEDRIIGLHNEFSAKGWPVIAIQPNDPSVKPGDSYEEMKIRAEQKGFPFVYLFDEGQKVFPQYGATRTPHVYLVDSNLKVRYIGAIDNNPQDAESASEHYVADAIAAIEAGKEPDPNFTKAIGCSIKVKK